MEKKVTIKLAGNLTKQRLLIHRDFECDSLIADDETLRLIAAAIKQHLLIAAAIKRHFEAQEAEAEDG